MCSCRRPLRTKRAGRVQRPGGDDDALRADGDGAWGTAEAALNGEDARRHPGFGGHPRHFGIGKDASTAIHGALQVRFQRAALGALLTTEIAVAALLRIAALHVARIHLHDVAELLGAAPQDLALAVHERLVGADVRIAFDRFHRAPELGREKVRVVVLFGRFFEHVVGRSERARPVDGRAAAETAPGQDRHAAILGAKPAALFVERERHLQLALGEPILGHVRALLHDDDVVTGLGELPSDHAAAGAAAHDDGVAVEGCVRFEQERAGLVVPSWAERKSVRRTRCSSNSGSGPAHRPSRKTPKE